MTPGVAGFIAIAVVAIVTILLVIDMTRRIRRTRYRAEIRERLEPRRTAPRRGPTVSGVTASRRTSRAGAAETARPDVGDDTERG